MDNNVEHGVYGIYYKDILLYIGSSNNINRRKNEHIKKLESGKHQKKLQKYVDENVKDLDELEFKIIHKPLDNSKVRLYFAEYICTLLYKPICNKPLIQIKQFYINLGIPEVPFDKTILKYI